MSKNPWAKHEKVEDEICDILKQMKIATANVILFELNNRGFKISYGAVARRLIFLESEELIDSLKNGSEQKVWAIHNF